MGAIAAIILAMAMSSGASDGLVRMAVTGSGNSFAAERTAAGESANRRFSFSNVIDPLLITCRDVAVGRNEFMAGGGVELDDGSKWAMVHPFCHPDHFIIEYADGTAERWDVGCDEGTKIPYLVSTTEDSSINELPAEAPWSAALNIQPGCSVPTDNDDIDCTMGGNPVGSMPNEDGDACVCPDDMELYEDGGSSVCADLKYKQGEYSANNCTDAGWETEHEIDSSNYNIRELCNIGYEIAALQAVAALSANPSPLQTSSGDSASACVLTENGFTGGNALAKCEDESLFGAHKLPQKPENFAANARLTIIPATGGGAREIMYNGESVLRSGAAAPTNTSGGGGGGGGSSSGGGVGLAVGGIAVAGVLLYSFTGGTPEQISWAPQYSFFHNGGKTSYSYGSRWAYQKENWSAYWSAAQTGGESEWQYGSGVEWSDDIWTASFDGAAFGDNADLDLSLAARKNLNGWALKSGVNSAIRLDEFGAESSHRLFAEAALRRNHWTLALFAALNRNENNGRAGANIMLKRDL